MEIGPDLGDGECKFKASVLAKNGIIYCLPCCRSSNLLKIDTNPHPMSNHYDGGGGNDVNVDVDVDGEGRDESTRTVVSVLDVSESLPHIGGIWMWISGALASDGCIYFMPCEAQCILKLDPVDDTFTIFGEAHGLGASGVIGNAYRYKGTVADRNGYVYGIPIGTARILRFNPANGRIQFIRTRDCVDFSCFHGAIMNDDFIYLIKDNGVVLEFGLGDYYNEDGNEDDCYATHSYIQGFTQSLRDCKGWGRPVLGRDRCIYWPPSHASRTLKFDPETRSISLVGDFFFGTTTDTAAAAATNTAGSRPTSKWCSGAAASDGHIYCIPFNSNQVLSINPFREFAMTIQKNMKFYPKELGRLFVRNKNGNTVYQDAVANFGLAMIYREIIDGCIPRYIEYGSGSGPVSGCSDIMIMEKVQSFLVAASCDNSAMDVIYTLLTKNLDTVPLANYGAITMGEDCDREIMIRKRKRR